MQGLQKRLHEWADVDVVMCELGIVLGLYPETSNTFNEMKWVFWTDNPAGRMLHAMVETLTALGALEVSGDGEQYRWRAGFDIAALSEADPSQKRTSSPLTIP